MSEYGLQTRRVALTRSVSRKPNHLPCRWLHLPCESATLILNPMRIGEQNDANVYVCMRERAHVCAHACAPAYV